MTTETVSVEEKFTELLRKELEAKFHDEFVFEPIYVQADFDLDGNRCLDAYIVFNGNQKKLRSCMDRSPSPASVVPFRKPRISRPSDPVVCQQVGLAETQGRDSLDPADLLLIAH